LRQETYEQRAARFTADLETAALRAIARTYDSLNAEHFRGGLRRPVLLWTEADHRLGAWDAGLRQIGLSRRLLLVHGWGSLVEVLKHEMAHQYVHDVLGVRGETSHGPAFQRVCAERGIDGAAAGVAASPATDSDEHRALERVKKLLALGRSPNPHEAEAAMAAAQRLILKYNLEAAASAHASHHGFRHLGAPRVRITRAEHSAAVILRDHFFVEVIWVHVWLPLEGRTAKVLEICGTDENLELASYVYDFLLAAADRLWDEYRKRPDVRGRSYRQSFQAGVLGGFWEKLRGEQQVQRQEGLVWKGDPALAAYYQQRHPRRRSGRSTARHLARPFLDGNAAGRNLELLRPLRGGGGGPRLLGD
jgi:hypothetical protein